MPEKAKGRKTRTLCCPYCSHEQKEPAAVLSTYCRHCSNHYQVVGGEPVIPQIPSLHRVVKRSELEGTLTRSVSLSMEAGSRTGATLQEPPRTSLSFRPNGTSTSQCTFEDEVECSDCGHLHSVSEGSKSSLCPRCGSYVSLQNYDIGETWTRQIRTRGDVRLRANGTIRDTAVSCRNFLVEGDFNGTAECTGDLVIRRSCRILGSVKCRTLRIEGRAEVVFAGSVQAVETHIDGNVKADLTCSGRLELADRASLEGDINVAALVINKGARHNGRVSMVKARRV